MATGMVGDVERIAVLRANGIGDYVFALPALDALRAAYPQAQIVLLGAPWQARFLAGRPGPVSRVMVVPPLDGIRGPEEGEVPVGFDEFLERAGKERFDLALQIHGGGRNSNPIVNALGARVTAGLRATDAEPLDRWLRYDYYQPEVFRYLEVVSLVGAEPVTFSARLEIGADDLAEARQVAGKPARPRVALHPGATDPRRRWPVERFAEVADLLLADRYDVVVTGNRSERELADTIVARTGGAARSLAGQLSLGGLAGLLAECATVVSNDTGPLHVAAAVGASTVGIFWIGNMINGAVPLRGRHRPLASWTINCPVCGLDCTRDLYPARTGGTGCTHRESFVADVPVAEVLEAVRDLAG